MKAGSEEDNCGVLEGDMKAQNFGTKNSHCTITAYHRLEVGDQLQGIMFRWRYLLDMLVMSQV